MIDPIVVSCASKASKDTWLHHLSKIIKTNRFPSFGASPLQVSPPPSLSSSSLVLSESQDPSSAYTPSKTSPYVSLVEHFAKLIRIYSLFPDATTKSSSLEDQPSRKPIFQMKISIDSAHTNTTSSCSPSSSFGSIKKSHYLHPQLRGVSSLEKVSQKWRCGISNLLSRRNSRSPCDFVSLNLWSSLPILKVTESQEEPFKFLIKTNSLPLIPFSNQFEPEKESERGSAPKRGRLTRQDAFDFGDGDEMPDENENFEQLNFNEAREPGFGDGSFDSGFGFP